MERKELSVLLKKLSLLIPSDLNELVVQSDEIQYNPKPIQIWHPPPPLTLYGIISHHKQLYICDVDHESTSPLRLYTLEGEIIENKSFLPLNQPSSIDIYENNLYICDNENLSIWTFQFELLSLFPIPNKDPLITHLKVDNGNIYVTIEWQNQILMYTRDGKLKNKIGSINDSSQNGAFHKPRGLTVDIDALYVCDFGNHRIQVLSKDQYVYLRQWGEGGTDNGRFRCPSSICYNENILYIGDMYCVQLFLCDGTFLQRMGGSGEGKGEGEFNVVGGICVVGDRLYVTDFCNDRIQVFRLKTQIGVK